MPFARSRPSAPMPCSLLLILGHLLTIWALCIWVIKHYPDAGESHVHWQPDRPRLPKPSRRPRGSDPISTSHNRFRNAMRARGRAILIGAATRLRIHAVLTVRTPATPDELVAMWLPTARRLNRLTGHAPYLAVPHFHSGMRGHIHLLVPRRIPYRALQRIWPHGHVRIYASSTDRHTHREAGRILARYVTRSWVLVSDEWPLNARRYWAPRRFVPRWETATAESLREARQMVTEAMGAPPTESWNSTMVPDWSGPPVAIWRWP